MPTLSRLEQCLLPPPETICWDGVKLEREQYSTIGKTAYCVKNFFAFAVTSSPPLHKDF